MKNKKIELVKQVYFSSIENVPILGNSGENTTNIFTILYLQKDAVPFDGRPVLTFDANALIADANSYIAKTGGIAFDYEHQIDIPVSNGAIPAAAWATSFHNIDGSIYVTFEATPKLSELIANKEYRAFSPTMYVEQNKVVRIIGGGFTNRPAFLQNFFASEELKSTEENKMLFAKLKEKLATFSVSVAEDATEEQIVELYAQTLTAKADEVQIYKLKAEEAETQSKALTEQVSALTAEVATFKEKAETAELEAMFDAALADGKVIPTQKESLMLFARSDKAAFVKFLESTPAKKLGNTIVEPSSAVKAEVEKGVDAELYAQAEAAAKRIGLDWNDEKRRESFIATYKTTLKK